MTNVNIKLNKQLLDYSSDNFNTVTSVIAEYDLIVENNEAFLDELFSNLLEVKGDWINFSYDDSLGTCYVTVDLIFHGTKMDTNSSNLLDKILDFLDVYIASCDIKINKDIDDYSDLDEEGFFVYFDEDGGSCQINHLEIEKKFKEDNINYRRVALKGNHFEGGCGSASESVIYFFLGAVGSGITWDLIKSSAKYLYGQTMGEVSYKKIDSKNFKSLRKDVADKLQIDEQLLVLQELYKMNDDIAIVFKTKDNQINLITDFVYTILEMKVE